MPRNSTQPRAEPSKAQLEAREAGAARLRAAAEKKRNAKEKIGRTLPTRSTRHDLDSDDVQVREKPRKLPGDGKARLESADVEIPDRPPSPEKLAALAFEEEMLTIMVHETTNVTDEPVPYVICSGRRQAFLRGQQQDVRRKFVGMLARQKPTTFTQRKYKDDQGIDGILNIPHTAVRWPFSVLHDPNPKGRAWLTAILAEA